MPRGRAGRPIPVIGRLSQGMWRIVFRGVRAICLNVSFSIAMVFVFGDAFGIISIAAVSFSV